MNEQMTYPQMPAQPKLPNATAVLVLGILSIVGCCCYGLFGLISGGIGLYLAKKDEALYAANPNGYSNYQNLKTGKILCYIGLGLSALYFAYVIWLISVVGVDALTNPALMQERIQQMFPK